MLLQHRQIAPGTGHVEGRRLLAQMYRNLTGSPLPEILVTERGKPCFSHGNLHFSITHTKNHVFCALSENPVGIDAEELSRKVKPRLAEKILSEGEFAQYLRSDDKNRALLTFWVLKEARAKFLGTGLRGYPNDTNFRLDDSRVRQQDGCLLAVIENEQER